jgi:hypothetical protein
MFLRMIMQSCKLLGVSAFDTILISACTSAGVALAIEWSAKPGLEARKERILERHRAQREIARQLKVIVSIAGSLSSDLPATLSDSERRRVMRWLQDRRAEVVQAGQAIDAASIDTALNMNHRLRAVVARTAGLAQGIALSDKVRQDASRELHVAAGLALDLYLLPRWRFRRRWQLLAAVETSFLPPS